MRAAMLVVCVVFTGCGSKTYRVDPLLQPYVDSYIAASQQVYAPVVIDNLIAEFGETSNTPESGKAPYAGTCTMSPGTPTIIISTRDWPYWDAGEKEELMFHELGHCVLFRLHNNALDKNGTPVSIMFHQMQWSSTYELHRNDWLYEMFWYKGPGEQN
jgi:hypothetical protein